MPAIRFRWLTRFVILRLLGLVYLMAFLTLVDQGPALLGRHGLLPLGDYLDAVAGALGSRGAGFRQLPSIFWLSSGDGALRAAGWLGVALSAAVLLGYANAVMLAVLCALQLSIATVGGTFYAFGWEIQLVETGFLCIFLCPLLDGRPFPRRPPPAIPIWLLLWLVARIMWGAGLIKLRGDACWRDLTCLDFHFETQPVPSPLSQYFHALPSWGHKVGVLFNHVAELAAPFLLFAPRRARIVGGCLMAALQFVLPSRRASTMACGGACCPRRWSGVPGGRAPRRPRRARRGRPRCCWARRSPCSAFPSSRTCSRARRR